MEAQQTAAIEDAIKTLIAGNPCKVTQARVNPNLTGWFVGQVMKATDGKINMGLVRSKVEVALRSGAN